MRVKNASGQVFEEFLANPLQSLRSILAGSHAGGLPLLIRIDVDLGCRQLDEVKNASGQVFEEFLANPIQSLRSILAGISCGRASSTNQDRCGPCSWMRVKNASGQVFEEFLANPIQSLRSILAGISCGRAPLLIRIDVDLRDLMRAAPLLIRIDVDLGVGSWMRVKNASGQVLEEFLANPLQSLRSILAGISCGGLPLLIRIDVDLGCRQLDEVKNASGQVFEEFWPILQSLRSILAGSHAAGSSTNQDRCGPCSWMRVKNASGQVFEEFLANPLQSLRSILAWISWERLPLLIRIDVDLGCRQLDEVEERSGQVFEEFLANPIQSLRSILAGSHAGSSTNQDRCGPMCPEGCRQLDEGEERSGQVFEEFLANPIQSLRSILAGSHAGGSSTNQDRCGPLDEGEERPGQVFEEFLANPIQSLRLS
ncbi:hypothetical protein HF521_018022 [Silurus meridionalis]|uniref:Uncharacterized protein n=1 Tax=Silurus meridionalis TaxID=175797 RepID=A0A8T0BQ37_SILME|nr:hypothetical protein HF521_018022 [Silurus meridionalis]